MSFTRRGISTTNLKILRDGKCEQCGEKAVRIVKGQVLCGRCGSKEETDVSKTRIST